MGGKHEMFICVGLDERRGEHFGQNQTLKISAWPQPPLVPLASKLHPPSTIHHPPMTYPSPASPTIAQTVKRGVQPRAETASKLTVWLMLPRKKRFCCLNEDCRTPTLPPQSSLRGAVDCMHGCNMLAGQVYIEYLSCARNERKSWSPFAALRASEA